jgi:LysM repeat protein
VSTFGRYVATFDISYKDDRFLLNQGTDAVKEYTLHYRYVFWLIPWIPIVWVLLSLVGVFLLVLLWRWFGVVQRKRVHSEVHEVQAGESLQQIAIIHGIDVRTLIRFNALRWPFEMNPGEYLLIPHYDQPRSSLWYGLKTGASEMLGGFWSKILVVKVFKKQPKVSQLVLVASSSSPSKTDKPVKTEMSLELEKLIVDEGDTIYDVASFAGTSWDVIASINHLKPPYRLIPGEEILAPRKVELPIEEVTVIVEKEEIIVAPKKTVAKEPIAKKATTKKIVQSKSKRQTKRSTVAKRTIKKKSSK